MIYFTYRCYSRQTINSFLSKKGYSEGNIYYLIKNQNVLDDNNVVIDKNHKLHFNSLVKVTLNKEENNIKPLNQKINVLYEDDYILLVNKPYNLDIEPTKNNYEKTLANMISYYYKNNCIESKIHLINRLDKLTSGIVILAKNQYIHNLFKNVKITKKYKALLIGKVNKKQTLKIKIAKDNNSIKRIVNDKGKVSITKYKLLSYLNNESLVDIKLITGRTHQIRLSFAHINHPLKNDPLYGKITDDSGMFLKAYYVCFIHPILHKKIKISI